MALEPPIVMKDDLLLLSLPLSLGDCWVWSLGMFMVDAKLELRGMLPSLRPRGSDGFLGRCLGELSGVWSISLNATEMISY